jgi:predicted dehydrogenase
MTDRREFLKTTAVATAGASLGLMASGNFAYARGSDTIRVGVIGCGGRGTGAAANCVEGSEGMQIAAMGDLFEDRLDQSRKELQEEIGAALTVTDDTAFIGFDAYQRVIESDVDLIILATPPVFRPLHIDAVVAAGKHLFTEKPVAVDPVGVRRVIAAGDIAAQKGLSIVSGTQRRHDAAYIETMRRIHDGAIGEVLSAQVYWNQGGLWNNDRLPGQSDMEFMLRNWLYYTWASGDHIVEQHIHNIDVANWAFGGNPVRANGVGGRQVRVDPKYGHIFDHFCIEFEYANGARVISMCRQQDGTARYVGERIAGTLGHSDGHSYIEGPKSWKWAWPNDEPVNPYVQEHTDLVAAIRAGEPVNEARRVAESTLSAIMGREAAYTGQVIEWDEIMSSNLDITPTTWEFGSVEATPVAQPGITQLERPRTGHRHENITRDEVSE